VSLLTSRHQLTHLKRLAFPRPPCARMNETLEDGEYDYADVSDVDYGASATTAPIAPTAPSIPVCTHDGFVLAAYLAAVERESVRALEEDGVPTAAAAARVGRLLWRYTDELTAMDRYLNSVLATRPAEQQQQQQQRTEATGGPLTTSAAALIAQRFHVLARRAVHMFRVDARLLACRPSTQALSTPTAPDASAGTLEETLEGSSHIDTVPPSVSQRVRLFVRPRHSAPAPEWTCVCVCLGGCVCRVRWWNGSSPTR